MQMNADEAAILKLHDEFVATWNRGDAKALADFFAEDSVRIGAVGDVARGRQEIRAAFERMFGGWLSGGTAKTGRGSIRFLSTDFALWEGSLEIVLAADRPHLKGHIVDVMKRVGSRWLILESHPKLFPPPAR